jgi:hypothetical protein
VIIITLGEYVRDHTQRGDCTCGKCIKIGRTEDGELLVGKPDPANQPTGHTADVHFFKVAAANNPTKEEFLALVTAEYPHWLDGKEHGYMEMGGDMGDQGIALTTQALGELLGVWHLMTPESMLGQSIGKELLDQMAGMGMVTIKV